jgi:hypothetical protein
MKPLLFILLLIIIALLSYEAFVILLGVLLIYMFNKTYDI